MIVARRGSQKTCRPLPVRQCRPHNLPPYPWVLHAKLVEDTLIKVDASKGVRVLSRQQHNPAAVRKICAEFCLVELHTGDNSSIELYIIPSNPLCLCESRGHKSRPRSRQRASQSRLD